MRLRADVEVELNDRQGKLHDRLFDRRITLGPIAADVVRALDGRSLDELVAATGHSRTQVEEATRTLLHLNLVDGAGTAEVNRARALRGGEKLGRIVLAESRFGCVGSADCCQSYHFGPLTDEDIARLDGLDIAGAFPELEAPYYYERDAVHQNGEKWRFLRAVNNRCLFLLDDCRCGLHAKFGYESKPGLCRFYPFEEFATLDGIQVYDKGGCSEYATTARSGRTYVEQMHELAPLMPAPLLHHPVALLDARTPVDFGYVQPLLRLAVDELERPPAGAPEMLRGFSRRARVLSAALNACEIAPEGPKAALEAVLARPIDLAPATAEAVRAGASAWAQVSSEVSQALAGIISNEHHSAELYSGRQSKELFPILHLMEEIAAHVQDPSFALSEYAREVAAVSIDDPDVDDVLRLSVRNQLFGHGALVDDRVVPAELRTAMVVLVATWGGRLQALAAGRRQVAGDDLSRSHMLAMRVHSWTAIKVVFRDEEAQGPALLEALPELVRWK